ncbi:hypothetical protein [Streptomyces sp. NPDC006855]|uniref:hypothetical protein n=1 Tax=unclassified Streptomyces TaxID=2593676 RepID=UPI0036851FC9
MTSLARDQRVPFRRRELRGAQLRAEVDAWLVLAEDDPAAGPVTSPDRMSRRQERYRP